MNYFMRKSGLNRRWHSGNCHCGLGQGKERGHFRFQGNQDRGNCSVTQDPLEKSLSGRWTPHPHCTLFICLDFSGWAWSSPAHHTSQPTPHRCEMWGRDTDSCAEGCFLITFFPSLLLVCWCSIHGIFLVSPYPILKTGIYGNHTSWAENQDIWSDKISVFSWQQDRTSEIRFVVKIQVLCLTMWMFFFGGLG